MRTTEGAKERPLKFNNEGSERFRTMLFERDQPGTELEGAAGFVGMQLRANDKTKEVQIVEMTNTPPSGHPAPTCRCG